MLARYGTDRTRIYAGSCGAISRGNGTVCFCAQAYWQPCRQHLIGSLRISTSLLVHVLHGVNAHAVILY